MKRLIVGTMLMVLILLAANAALAEDFKGFYVGAIVGGVAGRSDAQTSTVFSPTGYFATSSVPAIATAGRQNLNSGAFNGGGTAGYNFQTSDWVLGVELDFGTMRIDKPVVSSLPYPCCPGTGFTVSQRLKTNWLFTARPRIGYVHGKVLYYVTGGVAMTGANYQAVFTDSFASAHENGGIDETKTGWTAGGGLEYLASKHFSVKGEYLYADFGSSTTTSTNLSAFTPAINFPTNVFTHSFDLRAHIYRAGFNYRF